MALQLSFDSWDLNSFECICRSKQYSFHRSRGRKGGGDLILVVRIFMRGVSVRSFVYFLGSDYFLSLFKRDFDRFPDCGRDLQIACDKRTVGTELLFGNCGLRECPSQSTDLQSGKSGRLGGWIDRVLDF